MKFPGVQIILCCMLAGYLDGTVSAMQVASTQGNPTEGTKLVTKSALGAWMLREDSAHPGLNCAVRFLPTKSSQSGFAIFGPTANSTAAVIMFSGADIPKSKSAQDVQVELVQQRLPSTRLKATQLPRQPGSSDGSLAIGTGDIRQTMKSMRDQEEDMELRMEGTTVLSLDYDQLDLARTAMLDCVAGKQFVGQTLREATAEIRPVGNSTITGQAFYKAAVLAKKQYPLKGSHAVGLVWMSDEFKEWYEQVKLDQKIPKFIPQSIHKHFLTTRILDDKGNFAFTNLPAGEFILVANFTIEKKVSETEVVGRTDTFIGGNYVGSTDQVATWNYLVKEGTSFEKHVVIPNDGDKIEVSLDKSLLFCFLVCF